MQISRELCFHIFSVYERYVAGGKCFLGYSFGNDIILAHESSCTVVIAVHIAHGLFICGEEFFYSVGICFNELFSADAYAGYEGPAVIEVFPFLCEVNCHSDALVLGHCCGNERLGEKRNASGIFGEGGKALGVFCLPFNGHVVLDAVMGEKVVERVLGS